MLPRCPAAPARAEVQQRPLWLAATQATFSHLSPTRTNRKAGTCRLLLLQHGWQVHIVPVHVGGQRQAPGQRAKAAACVERAVSAWWSEPSEEGAPAASSAPQRSTVAACRQVLKAHCNSPRSTTWILPQERPARSSALRTACTRLSSSSPKALSCRRGGGPQQCMHAASRIQMLGMRCSKHLPRPHEPHHGHSADGQRSVGRGLQPPRRRWLVSAADQCRPLLFQRSCTQLAGAGHFRVVWREHARQQRVVQQATVPAGVGRGGAGRQLQRGWLNRCGCIRMMAAVKLPCCAPAWWPQTREAGRMRGCAGSAGRR